MTEERIDAVMQKDIIRLTADMPVRDAVAALVNKKAQLASVLDDTGTLIGVITQKDCFRSALNASYYRQWRGSVKDYMTTEAETLEASTDFVTAAQAFLDKPYRAYPVLRDGELVGVLRRTDLLAAFLHFG
jgi:CBS-domain-containing membrane protein